MLKGFESRAVWGHLSSPVLQQLASKALPGKCSQTATAASEAAWFGAAEPSEPPGPVQAPALIGVLRQTPRPSPRFAGCLGPCFWPATRLKWKPQESECAGCAGCAGWGWGCLFSTLFQRLQHSSQACINTSINIKSR